MVRLIRRDQNTTPQGDVGKLDFDPLCACQDSDGLKLANLNLTSVSADKMIANVTLNFSKSTPSNSKKLRLTLVKVAGDWRVEDVAQKRSFDLRKILK
jgi:hypothetical protein